VTKSLEEHAALLESVRRSTVEFTKLVTRRFTR